MTDQKPNPSHNRLCSPKPTPTKASPLLRRRRPFRRPPSTSRRTPPPTSATFLSSSLSSPFPPLLPTPSSHFSPSTPSSPPRASRSRDGGGGGSAKEDVESVYLAWLRSRFHVFVTALVVVAVAWDAEGTVRDVLDTMMEFVEIGK